MRYQVRPTDNAMSEVAAIYEWLLERTEQHAPEWLAGLEDAIQSLSERPGRCPRAPEADIVDEDVRQLLYGTRRHAYRILYIVRGDDVFILHVRHGARQYLSRREIRLPPGHGEAAG